MTGYKRIIFTVTNDLSTDQRMHRICSSLHNSGHEVLLVGRTGEYTEDMNRDYNVQRLNVKFKRGVLFYLEFNMKLLFFLLKKNSDIIVAIDLDTIIGARIAAWIKGVKLGFDAHEYYVYSPELQGRKFKQNIWMLVEKVFLRNIELAYTVNHYLAETFEKRYGFEFSVIRNLPLKRIPPPSKRLPESDPIILIYQGVMNVGRAIRIYIDALKNLPGCELWLVGHGDIFEEIVQYVSTVPHKDRIKIYGKLSPQKLQRLTDNAHIGLNMLSPESKNYYYSLANKFFDYMASGCPSINMDFPIYRQYLEKYEIGVMVENYQIQDFINAVNSIINHPDQYMQMSVMAIRAIEELNWEREAEVLINLFAEKRKN